MYDRIFYSVVGDFTRKESLGHHSMSTCSSALLVLPQSPSSPTEAICLTQSLIHYDPRVKSRYHGPSWLLMEHLPVHLSPMGKSGPSGEQFMLPAWKFLHRGYHVYSTVRDFRLDNSPPRRYRLTSLTRAFLASPLQTTLVHGAKVTPVSQTLYFKTQRNVPRVGVMLVGLGGNNGSTVAAGILANKHDITWNTKASAKMRHSHSTNTFHREVEN